jgi:chromosome segregation ATPase
MENEQSSQFGNQATSNQTQADKEWSTFERDLDSLGRQLAALQAHTAALGSHLVSSLEARFEDVKARAASFRQARELELEQVRQAAWQQAREAESTFSEARARSTEAARQMWERAEPLRQGAKDVGEGLLRAWGELRASFGKAAGRLHTESETSTTSGRVPATTEDRRDSL